jgi:hypothetical protein
MVGVNIEVFEPLQLKGIDNKDILLKEGYYTFDSVFFNNDIMALVYKKTPYKIDLTDFKNKFVIQQIIQDVYWDNINYDIESIKNEFDDFLFKLEQN